MWPSGRWLRPCRGIAARGMGMPAPAPNRGLMLGLLCAVSLVTVVGGCGARMGATPESASGAVLYSDSIERLVPLHAGDWFIYRAEGDAGGEYYERVTLSAADRPNELVMTLSTGDTVRSRVRLRLDAEAVRVVSETDVGNDIGAVYATPLPLHRCPVREQARATSAVELIRASDGTVLDSGEVELTVSSARDPASGDIVSRIDRQLTLPGGVVPATQVLWLRPGVGKIGAQSLGGARRELVCARIGGTSIGACPEP